MQRDREAVETRVAPGEGPLALTRPAWIMIAVAIALAAGWALSRPPLGPLLGGDRVRVVRTLPPDRDPARVTLAWDVVHRATRYEVRFFGERRAPLATVDAGAATHLTVSRAAPPPGLPAHGRVYWQVAALRGSDVLARSVTRAVELP